MAEFNLYSLYAGASTNQLSSKKDKVDTMVDELLEIYKYEEAQTWFLEHFGDVQGEKWIEYPDMDKKIYTKHNQERIEVCMLFKNKQYFGRGWLAEKQE